MVETAIKKRHGYLLVIITIIIFVGVFLAYSMIALKPAPVTTSTPAPVRYPRTGSGAITTKLSQRRGGD